MKNTDIEVTWKVIDQWISEAELCLFETFDIIDNIEKLSIDVFKNKLDKSVDTLYVYVIKILEKINLIVRIKILNKFFIQESTEIIAILNYSYEWLLKNYVQNKIQYSNIYDYNYWKNISFFKLIISCADKISFTIYCLENEETIKIRNTIKSKEEQIDKIIKKQREINFDNLVEKLKNNKETIKIFNDLEMFHKKVKNSSFWKTSKKFRNDLEHKIFSYKNKIGNFNDLIIVNIFINIKLLWIINIKSNVINLTHIDKILSTDEYTALYPIIKYISDIENKIEIINDTPDEIKLIVHDLEKALAGEKIDWNKYSGFIDKIILDFMMKTFN